MSLFAAFRPVAAAVAIAALGIPATLSAARAAVVTTVTYSPFGLPAANGPVNSIDLTGRVGQSGFTVNSGANAVTVSTNGGAIVQGSSSNNYAAPVTGGTPTNPTFWTAPYTSTGGAPGTVTFSFASAQSYFGLLWGSVGSGDYISFLDGAKQEIARVDGTTVMNSAAGFNDANGARGFGGSQYTLINLTGGQFSSIVMGQTGGPSFEAAGFQYAASNVAVPEPATIALVGLALTGFTLLRRRNA